MNEKTQERRGVGLALVGAAYATAGLAAWLTATWLDGSHPLLVVAAADLAATFAVFAWSVGCNNSSVYDPYWSVAPIPIACFWAFSTAGADADLPRRALVVGLVTWWGIRLTGNWVRRWRGLDDEDWRYAEMRPKAGAFYWPVSLLGFHLMPTITVFLGCLSIYVATTSSRPLGVLDVVAAAVTAGAIVIETVADRQLHRFVASAPPKGALMEGGLWAFSRHPNYFGEVLFWWGLFLLGVAADPSSALWTWIGPAWMTLMFVAISIPMMDRRMAARRPAYADRMRRVSRLVPWIPRRS